MRGGYIEGVFFFRLYVLDPPQQAYRLKGSEGQMAVSAITEAEALAAIKESIKTKGVEKLP